MPRSTESPLVYEINTRCWLHDLSGRDAAPSASVVVPPATLHKVPDHQFTEWHRLGFTHIWLMGVWECGPLLANDDPHAVPSPYAITHYTVPEALGGNSGLAHFRRRLHAHGLKLLLDFVPNHTSRIHPWTRSHPERYVTSSSPAAPKLESEGGASFSSSFFRAGRHWIAHGKDPYFPAWADTAQLDYRNPDTRDAMIRELTAIAGLCDGARCDMSMLLLNDVFTRTWTDFPSPHPAPQTEFWSDAITRVRQSHPEFLFLAEAYWDREQDLLNLGFDCAYDKRVYDHVIARNPRALIDHLRSKGPDFLSRTTHFLENHDEPRIASLLNFEEHRAAALLLLALPGMRLLHEGQLAGAAIRAGVHRIRRPAEPVQPAIRDWYEQLLASLKDSAVGHGAFALPATPENVIAIRWQNQPGKFDLVLVNLGQTAQPFILPAGKLERDRLGRAAGPFSRELVLPPHAAHFLEFTVDN
jgi:glycosidase